jgi:hypothetical protein
MIDIAWTFHVWQITFFVTLFFATWFGYEILESSNGYPGGDEQERKS